MLNVINWGKVEQMECELEIEWLSLTITMISSLSNIRLSEQIVVAFRIAARISLNFGGIPLSKKFRKFVV